MASGAPPLQRRSAGLAVWEARERVEAAPQGGFEQFIDEMLPA
jgi:hypothetical protein